MRRSGPWYFQLQENAMNGRPEHEQTMVPQQAGPAASLRFCDAPPLGAGGQATVLRMRDVTLERDVAMKVLKPELAGHAEEIARFVGEARITAGLEHPHVPAVHELGVREGAHFFTMKLVEGQTFAALLEPTRFEPTDDLQLYRALQVLMKVCEAMAFAHARGVLHCDLKPANVMVGPHGQVYVMDWGISRRISHGAPGATLGTLGYMSPEQAHGEALDARTDVFSLGAMLYKIIAGTPPYYAVEKDEWLELAKRGEVFVPRRPVSRRLLEIATKALSADRNLRQSSVEIFQAELESYVRGASRYPEWTFEKGAIIVREGEEADCAYLIHSGKVEASRKVKGRKKVLRKMGPGVLFGESAIFESQPRTATVRALEPTRVSILSKRSLIEEMGRADVLSMALTSVLQRFHEAEAPSRARKRR
jgi:eukaryotic-like serine/threonine-protein kinase